MNLVNSRLVVPAKAGTQVFFVKELDPRFRGGDAANGAVPGVTTA